MEGKIILEPIPEEAELVEKDGLLIVRPRVTENLSNCVQQDRKDRIAQLTQKIADMDLPVAEWNQMEREIEQEHLK